MRAAAAFAASRISSGGWTRAPDRVIIGTMAICHPDEFALAVYKFGNKIVAGIDAKDGYFAVSGWTEQTDVKAVDFGKKVRRMGLEYALFTDISKDGVLGGANVEATVNMSRETGLNVIASGGVSTLDDIVRLKESGIYGAVLGRAIYDGALDLSEAIRAAK